MRKIIKKQNNLTCLTGPCDHVSTVTCCTLGRVENGNQRVFKNLLAIFAAIWYIDWEWIVKKKARKSFSGQEIDLETGTNH